LGQYRASKSTLLAIVGLLVPGIASHLAQALEFDCTSLQQRVRDLDRDVAKDAAEYVRVKGEVESAAGRFMNEPQAYALTQQKNYILYIRKQVPMNAAQLKTEFARASRYKCLTPAELDELQSKVRQALATVQNGRTD
jgi:hypothetical protein